MGYRNKYQRGENDYGHKCTKVKNARDGTSTICNIITHQIDIPHLAWFLYTKEVLLLAFEGIWGCREIQ